VEAAQEAERHGVSAFGDLKYAPNFKHFDYVNPNAPKGGVFSHIGATRAFNQNFLTFNSLNSFILKGDGAQGMELTFARLIARAVPLFVAALPIFSRSYYSKRPFEETTLEVPLGSGPYKVGRFEVGRHIEYERVKDWWGADLPVARGQNNFDIVRYEYYRDREVAFEGFTAKSYLFREEFTSR